MKHGILLLTLFAATTLVACHRHVALRRAERDTIAEARTLDKKYQQSVLAPWDIHVWAADADCKVLWVQTSVVMTDEMIDAIHYGGGEYGVTPGGFGRFYREHGFRGVIYKDLQANDAHTWIVGDLRKPGQIESPKLDARLGGPREIAPELAGRAFGRMVICW